MGDATIWAGNITTGEVKKKLVNTRKQGYWEDE